MIINVKIKFITVPIYQKYLDISTKLNDKKAMLNKIKLIEKVGKKLIGNICPTSEILIGFTKIPFREFVDYMDLNVIPYAHKMSLKPENEREEFLKAVLN